MVVVDQLRVSYAGGCVLDSLSFTLRPGDRVGISGASGSGKTTLLTILAGLGNPSAKVSGRAAVAGKVGYIPQEATHSLSPFLRAIDQVAEFAKSRDEAASLLSRLGLDERRRNSFPHQLSGGERQRVLIAQALAMRPSVVLADEPTANLDEAAEASAIAAIDDYLMKSGGALLIASHQESVFARLQCRIHRLTPFTETPLPPAHAAAAKLLLRVDRLTKTYCHRDFFLRSRPAVCALAGVSLDIHRGETIALVGPSGSGKTTLARCLARRETWDSGEISPGEVRVQLAQQEPSESLNPRGTIAAALGEAQASPDVLESVGLSATWANRRVTDLSEGQRARVAIARSACAARGGLLILDESLASLDPDSIRAAAGHICELQRESGMACLLITHRADLAQSLAHRILSIREGRLE